MKRGKAKLLTDVDIKNCLRYLSDKPRDRAMFMVMLMTALRIHSIQKLTIAQVYDDNLVPRDSFLIQPEQNKGGRKALQIYINDELKKELFKYAKYLKAKGCAALNDYLFPSNKGGCLSKQQIIRIMRGVFNAVGLDRQYRCHSFRATALTKLMDAGYPLPLIQQISGHASISTLSIYYRSNPSNIRKAMETLKV